MTCVFSQSVCRYRTVAQAVACAVMVFAVSAVGAPYVHASVNISNSVSVSASSGESVESRAEGSSGSTEHSVHVETTVNGEVVESYTETSSDPIEYSSTYESSDGGASSSVEVDVQSDSTESNAINERADASRASDAEANEQHTTTVEHDASNTETTAAGVQADSLAASNLSAPRKELPILARIWNAFLGFMNSLFAYVSNA